MELCCGQSIDRLAALERTARRHLALLTWNWLLVFSHLSECLRALHHGNFLGFDEAFGEEFFVAKPEVGDVGGAEAKNVFECAANFAEAEVDADFFEHIDEGLRA